MDKIIKSILENPNVVPAFKEGIIEHKLLDADGKERMPGIDPKTGKYSTAQMLYDEFYGGDTSQPLDD